MLKLNLLLKVSHNAVTYLMNQLSEFQSEKVPGIQVAFGLKQCLGNWDLYRELLGKFWDDYGNALQVLASDGESKSKEQLLHHIRGASSNLGLNTLASHCLELREFLKSRGTLHHEVVGKFQEELEKVGVSIKTLDSQPHS
jgi:HPt (histidine-containing phosphotransfer) domain-containing protein